MGDRESRRALLVLVATLFRWSLARYRLGWWPHTERRMHVSEILPKEDRLRRPLPEDERVFDRGRAQVASVSGGVKTIMCPFALVRCWH